MMRNILLKTKVSSSRLLPLSMTSIPKRGIALNDIPNYELFEHKFTDKMEFKDRFERMPCFRVMDHEGKIINATHENVMDKDKLMHLFNMMVASDERDLHLNSAQRTGMTHFYFT